MCVCVCVRRLSTKDNTRRALQLTEQEENKTSSVPGGFRAKSHRRARPRARTERAAGSVRSGLSSRRSRSDAPGEMCSSRKILWSLLFLSAAEVGLGVASIILGAVGLGRVRVRGQLRTQQGDASPVWSGMCVGHMGNTWGLLLSFLFSLSSLVVEFTKGESALPTFVRKEKKNLCYQFILLGRDIKLHTTT